jgi:hypothetical protein
LGPLLFLLYINDLPKIMSDKTIPILFADDTSILVTSPSLNYFQIDINTAFNCINEWFKVNLLSINFNKTRFIQFTTKNKPVTNIKIAYDNKQITTISNIKFLGIYINDTITWKCHVEHIIPKRSAVCYIMRSIKPYTSLNTLKIVYYSYFNSTINYRLPFWGNSPPSIKICIMQKNIIRIMLGYKKRVSCSSLFRKLNILPLASQCIFSIMLFVIQNKNQFMVNSEIYSINTRQHYNLHQPYRF